MSFRDTFTRSQSSSQNLQYDDTAAYHFYTTILIILLIPFAISIIKNILNPFGHIPKLSAIEKKPQFKKKIIKFKKQNKYNYITCFFVFKLLATILIVMGLVQCYLVLNEAGSSMKGFDPYEILEVNTDATIGEIKKSYRKLALKYHPDRNQGDPQANAKFIMISKAYQCLTDEDKKANCQKFGNPEGSTSFNVGIALPSFLVKKQNQVVIMGVVFLLVVIVLPIFLIYYFGEVNKYDEFGMLQESHPFVNSALNQQLSIRDCVRVMALCAEFKNLRITRKQSEKLQLLFKQADEEMKKVFMKKKFFNYIKKAMVLIDARITDKKMPEELMDDFKYMLKKMPILVKATVMLAASRSVEMMARYRPEMFVGARAISSIIIFGQLYIQGLSIDSHPIQQLNLNDEQMDRILKKKKKKKITEIKDLKEFQQDRKYFLELFPETRQPEIKQSLEYIPSIVSLDTIVHIAGQQQITTMDVIEVIITVRSQRISNFCSSPAYPFLKLEGWYIIAEDKNFLLSLEHFTFEKMEKISNIDNQQKTETKTQIQLSSYELKFNMRAPSKQGSYSFNVQVLSDCYYGIDVERSVKYTVVARKQTPKDVVVGKQVEEEDESMFTKVMKSVMPTEQEQLSDKED